MAARDEDTREPGPPRAAQDYPLKSTTSYLNDRLGLYLSHEQQRGFATGLLVGTAIGAAFLAWNLMGIVRRKT